MKDPFMSLNDMKGSFMASGFLDAKGAPRTLCSVAVARLAVVGSWGGLYCMAVRPDARRRGLGVAVLHELFDRARQLGVTDTWLHVRAENDGARRLYQRTGFTEVAQYHYRTRSDRR